MAIDQQTINTLVQDIKKKKELSSLSNTFVRQHINHFLQKNPQYLKYLQSPKSRNYKKLIKEIRAELRRIYGLFRKKENLGELKDLMGEFKKNPDSKTIIKKILTTHSSTKERLSIYPELYKKIFSITGKPKTLLDLGCGINPFSFPLMGLKKLQYYAYDLSEEEIKMLNLYFNALHEKNSEIKGKAFVEDIQNYQKFPKADVALLLKMTDVLDRGKDHKKTELVLQRIPAKHVVVSFPTKTMSGKRMNHPRRKWIELLSKRLGYTYRLIEFENELFYVVSKS